MFKRASANYSLWPERTRPHRAVPLTFAVGGFAVGLVCTIAAYEVISEFIDPAIMQQSVAQSVSGDVPLLAAAVAPTTSQAPALETGRRGGGPRAPAAKVTLPIIGSHPGVPSSTTDGRGGEGLARGASVALAENSVDPASLIREEDDPARDKPAQEAAADEAKPAATEHPAKPRKKIVKKKRERPTSYAKRYYRERERPMIYAAPNRQGPVVSQTAIWY